MNLSYELIVVCIVNLIAIGVAFGSLRTKLEAQDRMLAPHFYPFKRVR